MIFTCNQIGVLMYIIHGQILYLKVESKASWLKRLLQACLGEDRNWEITENCSLTLFLYDFCSSFFFFFFFLHHLSPMCASINSTLYDFLAEKIMTQSMYSRVNLEPLEKYLCSLSRIVIQRAYKQNHRFPHPHPHPPLSAQGSPSECTLKKKSSRRCLGVWQRL